MGCVFGKEIAASEGRERGGRREKENLGVESGRKVDLPPVGDVVSGWDAGKDGENGGVELSDGGKKEEEKKGEEDGEGKGRSSKVRGERRRSKANPRLSNPPKNVHGEQVAAGWPSWLSAVAGEAIDGWVPRRADTFEKIDKVRALIFTLFVDIVPWLVGVWLDPFCDCVFFVNVRLGKERIVMYIKPEIL